MRVVNVGDVRQNLEAVATGRGDGRVGLRGGDQVDRRVGRQLALAEDGVEVRTLVLREEEVVVRELGVLAIEAEFEHETGAGGLEPVEAAHECGILMQQSPVGGDDLHVGDEDVGGMKLPVGHQAGHPVALPADFGHFTVEAHLDAEFIHETLEAEGNVVEAAVHVPEVVAELDGRQAIHEGRGVIGRGADVFDEVVKHVLEVARLEKPLHAAVHGAEQVKLRELAEAVEAGELLGGIQSLFEVAGIDEVVEVCRVFQEPLHTGGVFADLARLFGHAVGLGIQVHHRAVLEEVAPVRAQGPDRNVVGHLPSRALEQAAEDVRERENGRAEIEGVAVLLEQVKLAADLGVLLMDGDRVSLLGQGDSRGEPPKARSDNDDFLAVHGCLISFVPHVPIPLSPSGRMAAQ